MGRADLYEMQSGRMDARGIGLTQAGMILGLIETIFMIIGAALFCLGLGR
jgi:hypothetical protein